MPSSKFPIVLADPPWPANDQGSRMAPNYAGKGRAEDHYKTMSIGDIFSLGHAIEPLLADDAILFLWAPNYIVLEGDAKFTALNWGFVPKQLITWVKISSDGTPRIGGGHYTRVCTEQLLLCTRGKATHLIKAKNVPGVIMAPRTEHSTKPDKAYQLIETLCPDGPYLELFARKRWNEKWTIWGDQVPEQHQLDLFLGSRESR